MNKYLILAIVVIICVILGILNQTDKEVRQQTTIEIFTKSLEPKQPSQNFVYDTNINKIVPLTRLSEADAKRPCLDCHSY